MTAVQPESWDREGVQSLELRWIFHGELPTGMAEWFGRYPARITALQDDYLVHPYLPGLSVKIRQGRALEVKAYQGSPGLLEMAGRALGRLESWRKWSYPWDPSSQETDDPAVWQPVHKTRRISRFSVAGGFVEAHVPGPGHEPGCAIELTDVRTQGQAWWALGFEATGPADALPIEFEAAAELVFSWPLPAGVELGMSDSLSYAQWLHGRGPG